MKGAVGCILYCFHFESCVMLAFYEQHITPYRGCGCLLFVTPFCHPESSRKRRKGDRGLKPKVGGAVLAHSMRKELSLLG